MGVWPGRVTRGCMSTWTKIARDGGVGFGQEMEFDLTKILLSSDTRNSSKPR
jgi:hypothetical protein